MMEFDRSTPEYVVLGRVRVSWSSLGESGLDGGDWDENDPSDWESLRLDVEVNSAPDGSHPEWETRQDFSCNTAFPVSSTPAQRQAALELVMATIWGSFRFNPKPDDPGYFEGSPDKVLEAMSYIEPGWLDTGIPAGLRSWGQ